MLGHSNVHAKKAKDVIRHATRHQTEHRPDRDVLPATIRCGEEEIGENGERQTEADHESMPEVLGYWASK